MKHAPQYRQHAARQPSPIQRAEIALRKRAEAVIDAQVARDADQARKFLDAQKGRV